MFLKNAKEILILISERIGDAIFCTPAIAFLKEQLPEAQLTILALSKASATVYTSNPAVAEVLTVPSLKEFKKRCDSYHVLIDMHNSRRTLAYLPYWKKAAYISPRGGTIHQSTMALTFIQSLAGGILEDFDASYRLYPQAEDQAAINHYLKQAGVKVNSHVCESNHILIGFHMGCYQTASRLKQFWRKHQISPKDWPPKYFAMLQKMIYENYPQVKIVLTGVPSEAKLVKYLHQEIPNVINFIGKTSVLEMAALMSHFRVFLTGDTGPLHVAVSTRVPVIALFSVTDPTITGPKPLKPHHHVIYKRHLTEISPQEVFEIIKSILGKL